MTVDFLQQHWALVAASVLILGIALFVLFRLMQGSRRGRLAQALQHLRERERALQGAAKDAAKAGSRLEKLRSRGDSVPPGQVLAAKDALQAAQETERLLNDQVLVVRNNARMIILQDYPPRRHEALLRRCLGESR